MIRYTSKNSLKAFYRSDKKQTNIRKLIKIIITKKPENQQNKTKLIRKPTKHLVYNQQANHRIIVRKAICELGIKNAKGVVEIKMQ